jgi:hypothetical protein
MKQVIITVMILHFCQLGAFGDLTKVLMLFRSIFFKTTAPLKSTVISSAGKHSYGQ